MKIILLVLLTFSLSFAEFTRSGKTVTDSTTGLVWQDDATPAQMTWESAIRYCEELDLGGNTDWRLPNINELTSIVDDTTSSPAISSVFVNTTSTYYWSSTTAAGYTSDAWYVSFYYGLQYSYYKTDSNYVRCVRAGQ
jgi:hypothetical protein